MGQFISHKFLNMGDYELGYVQSLQYEDTVIHALAFVQLGSDYGGTSTYAWKLDRQLNVLEAKDLFGRDVLAYENPLFAGNYITIVENNDFVIFDRSFEFVRRVPFYFGFFPVNGLLVDSILVLHEHSYAKDSSVVYSLDWQGNIISKKESKSILHIFNLGQNIFTLDENHFIRKHLLADLTVVDSLMLPWSEGSEVNKISDDLFSFIQRNDNQTYTQIYDQDLNLIEEITSGLSFETELITKFSTNTIYQAGKYFRSIIPFVRKMNLDNKIFSRKQIEISHIGLNNFVVPRRTDTTLFGKVIDDFYFMGPGQQLYYDLTVNNISDTIVTDFAYFTDVGFGGFCTVSNNYRYVNNINLLPGEQMTFSDTLTPYIVDRDRGLLFYVGAANHLLADSSTSSYSIFDLTTRININNFEGIVIYPNPAENSIYLNLPDHQDKLKFQLFNLTGQLLVSSDLAPSLIDISDLTPGPYWIRLFDHSRTITKKFVKIE